MTKGSVCYECKCSLGDCNNNVLLNNDIRYRNCIKEICCCTTIHKYKLKKTSLSSNLTRKSKTRLFFASTKSMYSAALGIEILCIMTAEIGENIGLYTFGFNLIGIILACIIRYALAGFTTFMTILGRYSFSSCSNNIKIEDCCSILEQLSS